MACLERATSSLPECTKVCALRYVLLFFGAGTEESARNFGVSAILEAIVCATAASLLAQGCCASSSSILALSEIEKVFSDLNLLYQLFDSSRGDGFTV